MLSVISDQKRLTAYPTLSISRTAMFNLLQLHRDEVFILKFTHNLTGTLGSLSALIQNTKMHKMEKPVFPQGRLAVCPQSTERDRTSSWSRWRFKWVAKGITASLFTKNLFTRQQMISKPITSSSFISGFIISNFLWLIKIFPPQVLIMAMQLLFCCPLLCSSVNHSNDYKYNTSGSIKNSVSKPLETVIQ